MVSLRLLGSGSKDGGCPALYQAASHGAVRSLVVQGIASEDGAAVVVPHGLLDWADPDTTLTVTTTDTRGMVRVRGEPITDQVRAQLTLAEDETAVVVTC